MNYTSKPKTSLAYTTALFAICGFFLRSYQLKYELLFDGSVVEGSVVYKVLPWICILFLLGTAFVLNRFFGKLSAHHQCFAPSVLTATLQIVAGAALFGGNLYLQIAGRAPIADYVVMSEAMLKIAPYAGMLSGLLLAFYGLASLREKAPSPLLYMIISLYLVLRLLICFQEWNTDPSVHHYGYQLLAIICSMLGCFQLAGFGFDKGRRRISLFYTIGAVLFCAITVADTLDNVSDALINGAFLLSMGTSAVRLLFAEEPTEETK